MKINYSNRELIYIFKFVYHLFKKGNQIRNQIFKILSFQMIKLRKREKKETETGETGERHVIID